MERNSQQKGFLTDLYSGGTGVEPLPPSKTPLTLTEDSLLQTLTESLVKGKQQTEAYRENQHLQLTRIQAKILDSITEEKLEAASVGELVKAFSTLKDKENLSLGKATSITGIVGYLVQLEKEELEEKMKSKEPNGSDSVVVVNDFRDVTDEEPLMDFEFREDSDNVNF